MKNFQLLSSQCFSTNNIILLTLSLSKANLTKPRKLLKFILKCPRKPKDVTTQMKALNEYFLMVVFTLLLNRVLVCANFMFNLSREFNLIKHALISFTRQPPKLKSQKHYIIHNKNIFTVKQVFKVLFAMMIELLYISFLITLPLLLSVFLHHLLLIRTQMIG